jgi:hypothetical protein
MTGSVLSEAEYLRGQVRALRVKAQAAAFAVGAIRVLASPELGSFNESDRLDDVREQVERLAEALDLNPPRPSGDAWISCRCSGAWGGGRR